MGSLKNLFEPNSVALVGVSKDPSKISHSLIRNLVEGGFKKAIYPISPKGGEIFGYKVYPSLKNLAEPVDLVLFSAPANLVHGVIEDALENRAGVVVILSSGFGEISDKGGEVLEKEILDIAQKNKMRVMGPNCLGIYNADKCLNGTYLVKPPLMKGNIAFVSQSGAYGGLLVNEINRREIGLGKFVSIGNQIDIRHQEVVEYLSHDKNTDVIGLFVEGIKDGSKFISIIKKVSKIKPVVIFKGGRTTAGQRAAASHTGSLAGDFAVAKAAFQQAGALFAQTTEEFFDYLFGLACNLHCLPKDEKLAVLTISGGPSVISSDYCEEVGLVVPELGSSTKEKVRKYIPFFGAASNPVDMTVATPPENFGPCVDAVLADPDISGAISINWGFDAKEFAQAFVDAAQKYQKPLLAFVNECPTVEGIFRQNRIMNFPAPERVVRSYWGLLQYKRIREKKELEKKLRLLPFQKGQGNFET